MLKKQNRSSILKYIILLNEIKLIECIRHTYFNDECFIRPRMIIQRKLMLQNIN